MNSKTLMLLGLVLASAVDAGTTVRTTAATDEHVRIAGGGQPAVMRGKAGDTRSCGIKSGLKVTLRALGTPMVNSELELEITVANGRADGPVRSWIRLPEGVDAAFAPEWTDVLAKGQMVRHRATVRVVGGGPFTLTGKAASTAPEAAVEPHGEAYTTLYPLESTPEGMRAHWSATTLLPLSATPPQFIRLRSGSRATIIHGDQ